MPFGSPDSSGTPSNHQLLMLSPRNRERCYCGSSANSKRVSTGNIASNAMGPHQPTKPFAGVVQSRLPRGPISLPELSVGWVRQPHMPRPLSTKSTHVTRPFRGVRVQNHAWESGTGYELLAFWHLLKPGPKFAVGDALLFRRVLQQRIPQVEHNLDALAGLMPLGHRLGFSNRSECVLVLIERRITFG